MGAVNLRADNETQELQDQIDKMMKIVKIWFKEYKN